MVRCYVPHGVTAARIYNGTTDVTSANGYADVSEADAAELVAQGWTRLPGATAGATAARPTETHAVGTGVLVGKMLKVGRLFIDTTTSQVLMWNGDAWFDVITGTEV